ncbi:MAG: hypothetical protein ACR2NR_17135 [Solirubrobacteraceae bacterium]
MLIVVATALAFATVERPRGAYRATWPLVLALIIGGIGAILLLALLAVLTTAIARRRGRATGSPIQAATSLIVLGLAAALITAAALTVELWPRASATSADAPQLATFSAWQRDIVPSVLTYSDAIQFLWPTIRDRGRRPPPLAAVLGREAMLHELLRALGADARGYRGSPRLRALTASFVGSVREARAAAADLAAAIRMRNGAGEAPPGSARGAARRLVSDARRRVIRAQRGVQTFTFAANALGSRLFAQR